MTRFITLVATAACIACAPSARVGSGPSGVSTAQQPAADTLVGTVREVGSDPGTWLVISPKNGAPSVRLAGNQVALLRSVLEAEVWIRGRAAGREVDVTDFEVRGANGRPVDDGVVYREGNGLALRLRSGATRSIPDAPPALQQLVGARIWITPPVNGQSPTYGVIQKPN